MGKPKSGAVTVPKVNTDPLAVTTPEGEQAGMQASVQAPEWPQLPGGRRFSASYYFAESTIDALAAAVRQLGELASENKAGRVTKSDLVELAVVWALEDLKRNGEKSLLATLARKKG